MKEEEEEEEEEEKEEEEEEEEEEKEVKEEKEDGIAFDIDNRRYMYKNQNLIVSSPWSLCF